jgi:hypothetical protein
MSFQSHGNGFEIEGPLRVSYIHGIEIDRQDLCELLREKLQSGADDFAIGRARIIVEVIED